MWWRDRALEHGEGKKRGMEELVDAGREPGLLAYEDGEPVGWISVAPREEFHQLVRSPQYRPADDEDGVWSIVCFTIDKPARGKGLRGVLLDAAVEHAFARGAKAVEGYAHKEKRDDYMGDLELFVEHGFAPVRDKSKRVVVRKARG
jgi:GNAT superfamily N-acetyltransferase